jgi:peptide-methionine (R)-S-oxide reductase
MDQTQTNSAANDDWKKKLTPEQYHIMREGGTEAAFTGKYWNDHSKGMYKCAACGAELFSSDTKFDSGTGWPSFTEPANRANVELRHDPSFGMDRTEVICKNCGAHLGHVFDDGPADKGGKRYCINSVCLELEKTDAKEGAAK